MWEGGQASLAALRRSSSCNARGPAPPRGGRTSPRRRRWRASAPTSRTLPTYLETYLVVRCHYPLSLSPFFTTVSRAARPLLLGGGSCVLARSGWAGFACVGHRPAGPMCVCVCVCVCRDFDSAFAIRPHSLRPCAQVFHSTRLRAVSGVLSHFNCTLPCATHTKECRQIRIQSSVCIAAESPSRTTTGDPSLDQGTAR